jgi:hypothetical protein
MTIRTAVPAAEMTQVMFKRCRFGWHLPPSIYHDIVPDFAAEGPQWLSSMVNFIALLEDRRRC